MDIEELTLKQLREIAAMAQGIPVVASPPPSAPSLRIVVLKLGWVVVGMYSEDGDAAVITDAKVVRRWGTKAGLGELAASGPLANTILDPGGTVRTKTLAIVATFDCDEAAWNNS